MSTKRTYRDACGIARALDLVGERWALMIVRELLLGPKRFTDIREGLPHLSSDVLAQRLRELEQAGVVHRRTLPPPAASQIYELTEWGRELEPILASLGAWGACSPPAPAGVSMSFDAHLLMFKTMFDPAAAEGFDARIGLRLGDHSAHVDVIGDSIDIGHGEEAADATIATDSETLVALLQKQRTLAAAMRAGDVAIAGDRKLIARFLTLFPLPDPVLVH